MSGAQTLATCNLIHLLLYPVLFSCTAHTVSGYPGTHLLIKFVFDHTLGATNWAVDVMFLLCIWEYFQPNALNLYSNMKQCPSYTEAAKTYFTSVVGLEKTKRSGKYKQKRVQQRKNRRVGGVLLYRTFKHIDINFALLL